MEKRLKRGLKFPCFFVHDPEIQKKIRARASLWKDGHASIESALIKKEAKLRSSPKLSDRQDDSSHSVSL